MTVSLSLQEKKVLVPRGRKQAHKFSSLVENFGGIPVKIPLLNFRPATGNKEVEACLGRLSEYDWIIFTSQVTVETFFSFLDHQQISSLPKIAAIGSKTAKFLRNKGADVAFVPEEFVAEGFVEEFAPIVKTGKKILLPKGNLAREYIATELSKKGAIVDEVIIYETFFPEESKGKLVQALEKGELDILPFTSPSTVDHFMEVVNEYNFHEKIKDCIIGAIGPVTKKRCEEHGLAVHVMPEVYTTKDLLIKIMEYMGEKRI